MASLIADFLLKHGPCLSSELTRLLINSGLSAQAARKQISRATGDIRKLNALSFPKNARFFYHKSDYQSARYWDALLNAAINNSPSYGPALAGLRARGGIAPKHHFSILSGAPFRQKRQLCSDAILARLINVELISEYEIPGIGICVALRNVSESSLPLLRSRLATEGILLLAVKDWVRKLGIASYDKVAVRDQSASLPKVATFNWDVAGPSYLTALIKRKKGEKSKPGFFVCDVVLDNIVDLPAMDAFLRKGRTIRMLKNIAPILIVILADEFAPDAFRRGREEGVIVATPDTLFGKDVAEALKILLSSLKNVAQASSINPDVFSELFKKLSHIEGAAGNLRGVLFEYIVGNLVREIENGELSLRVRFIEPENVRSAEADVVLRKGLVATFYECKGNHPNATIDETTIIRWLEETVPTIYKSARSQSHYQNIKLRFEFWTCGSFSSGALKRLNNATHSVSRYEIRFKDGVGVRKYAAQQPSSSTRKILDEHYFKHPLSRAVAS